MRSSSSILLAAIALASCGGGGGGGGSPDYVALAKARFAHERSRGVDMSRGPCLGTIAPGWVVDVAHNPRQPVDDLAQNQCAAYREGKAKHFVELDPSGNLIHTG